MSVKGKNRAIYSYTNDDRSGGNFMYKNFDKANCYNSDFHGCNFDGASFRGTKLKFCNMKESSFCGTEFIGTNVRGTRFNNSVFKNAVFNAANMDRADFKGCFFYHCIFDGASITKAKNINIPEESNIIMTSGIVIPDSLLKCAENIIKESPARNSVIQLKRGKINRITLLMLLYDFSEEELVSYLPKAVYEAPANCTISRLKKSLIKAKEADNI